MQTSLFQLGLIATLAVGLGFSLASSDAVGYPSGAVVSLGSNPVWSVGGQASWGEGWYYSYDDAETAVVTVPADQVLVITDVQLFPFSERSQCRTTIAVDLVVEGRTAASVVTDTRMVGYGSDYRPDSTDTATVLGFESGLRVGPGESLTLNAGRLLTTGRSCVGGTGGDAGAIRYTMSGYYAQP